MASNNQTKIKSNYNMRNAMVNYYLLVMFTFFEMFLTNQYARARTDKFILFIVLSSILILSTIAISLTYHFDKNIPDCQKVIEHKPIFSLSSTDVAFLCFFIFASCSTLLSDYKLNSLLGNAGRDNGLVLIFLYISVYFIVSRFYYFKSYVLYAFMISGCIISALAILHFFYVDPLGIFNGYGEDVVKDFGTTIGNKNTIASYMCIFLPVATALFVLIKGTVSKIICCISIALAYMGLLVSGSNSGYIGFFAMLFFMAIVFVSKASYLTEFLKAIVTMLLSGVILRIVFSFFEKSKGFEAIGEKLVHSNVVIFVALGLILVIAVMHMFKDSENLTQKWPKNILRGTIITFGVLAVIAFFSLMYHYSVVDTKTDIGALSQILRFDDRWGTHRGFMWINGVKDFLSEGLLYQLFGSGCDTFFYVFEPHFAELSSRFHNSSTNTIHCEYLNYLITQGWLGLLSYLGIILTCVFRALKNSKSNELSLIFVFPVIAYCAQAVVNIYQPITTPFLIIFIALCECLSRKSNPVNKIR